MQGGKYESMWILLQAAIQFDKHHFFFVKDAVFSSDVHRYVNLCLDLQLDTIDQYISFNAITMISYYYSSIVLCETWHDDTSSSSFIIQDCTS